MWTCSEGMMGNKLLDEGVVVSGGVHGLNTEVLCCMQWYGKG